MKLPQFYVPPLASKDQYIQNVSIQQLSNNLNTVASAVTTTTSTAFSPITVVSPKSFGAFGDGNSHPITSADITNNPQWIGPFNQSPLTTYPVGTEWDTVAIQEAIYAAFASASTPGNVVWNGPNATRNNKMYCPAGAYQINRQIWMAAQGFDFEFEDRLWTQWSWNGYKTFTCNSHTSTTLDGISAADIANLFVGQYLFDASTYLGLGSIPAHTTITAINAAAGSITISNATTSTVTGLLVQPQTSMFQCDPVAYGSFHKVYLSANSQMLGTKAPAANGAYPTASAIALWVLDASGVVSNMLAIQQLTFYDIQIDGTSKTNYGMSILPIAGGAGQGDTVLFLNPYVANTFVAGIVINGANALSLQFINGDFQGNFGYGILSLGGSFYCYGTGFQNELNNQGFSPQLTQMTQLSADMSFSAGGGLSSVGAAHDVRSEASVPLISTNAGTASNITVAQSDQSDWFASYGGFQLLNCINPSVNNTKNRVFCCVDNGGNNQWRTGSPHVGGSSSGDTIVDAGNPGWTTNQWVGFTLQFRFGSNGFTEHFTGGITSNTTNSVTVSGSGIGNSVNANSLFTIATKSSSSAPNFDSAAAGNVNRGGLSQGINLTAGSSLATSSNSHSTGDYIIVPAAELFGVNGVNNVPQIVIPFVAEITNISSSTLTLSRTPTYSVSNAGDSGAPYYYGTPINDNGLQWLELPYAALSGLKTVLDCLVGSGYVVNCSDILGLRGSRTDHVYGGLQGIAGGLSARSFPVDISVKSGPNLKNFVAVNDAATIDLTSYFTSSDVLTYTPGQSATLNAPSPGTSISQEITLIILTSGGVSFTLTFGTNFKSSGTLATGTASGKYYIVKFVTDGTNWIEISRIGPL